MTPVLKLLPLVPESMNIPTPFITVIRQDAGRAELGLSIIGPSGRSVPYDIGMIPGGDHVTYVPSEPGIHQISITYGGLDVPGRNIVICFNIS